MQVSIVHEEEEKQQEVFVEFLQKLQGIMSDRAAVMKCFMGRFDDMRKELLQTEEDLQFLHCNAHVLLGFSTSCDAAMKKFP